MQNRNTFPKKEHLYGSTIVEALYEKGVSLFIYPYRMVYCFVEDGEVPVRCLVSAPKKRFKHAVDRNRLKRQMREGYRLNKHSLVSYLTENELHIHLGIHYVGQKLEPSGFMHKKMVVLMKKLEDALKEEKKGNG